MTTFDLIASYQKQIANLEWHLEVNKAYISEDEERNTILRINDFQNFMLELNKLEKENRDIVNTLLTEALDFLKTSYTKTELQTRIENFLQK